jgi:Uma2 family endonuclease
MTQLSTTLSFEDYCRLDAEAWAQLGLPEGRYEYWNGDLIEAPAESELNDWLAMMLRDLFVQGVNRRLVRVGRCEIEVPGNPRTHYPDVTILREEHLSLTQSRLLIRLDMPPPPLVVKIVSPGRANQVRDYETKRQQYQDRGIPEYWIVDPIQQRVTVLVLTDGQYGEAIFVEDRAIASPFLQGTGIPPFTPSQLFTNAI